LWAAGAVWFYADIDGKTVSRKYSPTSPVSRKGSVVFVIKVYRPCAEFPNGGEYTKWFEKNVNVGDSILMSGPIGKINYHGYGQVMYMK
jgi:nitrate reductase (NAD(P)H)